MFAVIKTGGKQYIVEPGKTIKIEKLPQEAGSEVVFDQVLLAEKGQDVDIGTPVIAGAKVFGKVVRQGRAKKVMTIKFKAKKRYKKKLGHKQPFTEVEIVTIAA
ncbi:MAG: 50S ribosomal protein L21 [Parcubacteria group bacterium]|nr:50S ribosomal protein L21 [Parcubacteria group bacterium]